MTLHVVNGLHLPIFITVMPAQLTLDSAVVCLLSSRYLPLKIDVNALIMSIIAFRGEDPDVFVLRVVITGVLMVKGEYGSMDLIFIYQPKPCPKLPWPRVI